MTATHRSRRGRGRDRKLVSVWFMHVVPIPVAVLVYLGVDAASHNTGGSVAAMLIYLVFVEAFFTVITGIRLRMTAPSTGRGLRGAGDGNRTRTISLED